MPDSVSWLCQPRPPNQSASCVGQRRKAGIVAGVRQMRSRPFHGEPLPLVGAEGGIKRGSGVRGAKSERNGLASSKAIFQTSHNSATALLDSKEYLGVLRFRHAIALTYIIPKLEFCIVHSGSGGHLRQKHGFAYHILGRLRFFPRLLTLRLFVVRPAAKPF